MKKMLLALITCSALTSPLLAEMVLVNLNGGASPDNWNGITSINTTTSNLIDSEKNVTGISLTTAALYTTGSAPGFEADVDWVVQTASSGSFISSGTGVFTFSGLEVGSEWKLEVVASHSVDYDGDFKVNSNWADSNYQGGMTGNIGEAWNVNTARLASDWMIWETVTADVNGDITLTATKNDGWIPVNALKLEAVPEPATMGFMVVIGGVGLFIRRTFMI